MKIVVLDGYAANPGDLPWNELKELGECVIYDRTTPDQVLERCKDADAILTNKVVLNSKTIESLPTLKYIGVLATGYNVIDLDAADKHGIIVTNIPSYSTNSVAQMVFAHILNILQGVGHLSDEVRNGRWTASKDFCFWDSPLNELTGKKIGIIGLGHIGNAVARIAIGFDMKVFAYTSKYDLQLIHEINKMDLEQLFSECDIITLHCPLTKENERFVNAHLLSLMKPTAILINTSRGQLIDEQALADALNNKKIRGAGVDVLSTEPPMANNPLLSARNCFITPHVAWATVEARQRLNDIMIANLKAFIEGKPVNVVKAS
jgi:glycerate dehydrogenase